MKQITVESLLDYKFLSGLQSNSSHSKAAFHVHEIDEKDNFYKTNIWVIDHNQHFQLTSSDKDSQFIWDNDNTLLFVSNRKTNDNKQPKTTFYRIATSGGEAQKAFTLNLSVSSIERLDSHRYLLIGNCDRRYPELYKTAKPVSDKDNEFYDIVEEIPFYANGQQMTTYQFKQLFLFNELSQELSPLTTASTSVSNIMISQDKQSVYVVMSVHSDVHPLTNELWKVDLNSKELTPIITEPFWQISQLVETKQGLLVLSDDMRRNQLNQHPQFRRVDVEKQTLTEFENCDVNYDNSIGSDVRYGVSKSFLHYHDSFIYNTTQVDHSELYKLNHDGQSQLISFDGSIDSFTYLDNQLIVIGQYKQGLQEIHRIDQNEVSQLTHFNHLDDYYVATPRTFEFESHGDTLKGYVLLPKDFDSTKQYPAILDIHGGPKTAYGTLFYHEMQVWANMDAIVFYTNPHGSSGRTNQFANIYGDYGTRDYDDLMTLTDEVCNRYPNIDTNRLAVTGGSYGGFMTNWIVSHTNRFKVAATQRSISNWISFYGVSDIGYFFAPDQIHGDLWSEKGQEKLWNHSPLKYVNNVSTPTLILHSKFDYRCPIDQGYQFFTALKHRGIDTRMVILNEENHDLSRSGKPKARLLRLHEITNWLFNYLKK